MDYKTLYLVLHVLNKIFGQIPFYSFTVKNSNPKKNVERTPSQANEKQFSTNCERSCGNSGGSVQMDVSVWSWKELESIANTI